MSDFMTPAELAAMLRVPLGTVKDWRYRSTGPDYLKLGRHVRYRLADVETWVKRQQAA